MVSRILGVLTKSAGVFGACLVSYLSGSQTVSAAVLDDPPGEPVLTQQQIDAFYAHPNTQMQISLSSDIFGANTQTLVPFGTMSGSLVSDGVGALQVKGGGIHKVIYIGGIREDLDFEIFNDNIDSQGLDRTADLIALQSSIQADTVELYSGIVGVIGDFGLRLCHAFVCERDGEQGQRETSVLFLELVDETDWAFDGDPLAIESTDYALSFETSEENITVLFEDNNGVLTDNGAVAGWWPSWRMIRCTLRAARVAAAMGACIACTAGCVAPEPISTGIGCPCAYVACCLTLQWIDDLINSQDRCAGNQNSQAWQTFMLMVDTWCVLTGWVP